MAATVAALVFLLYFLTTPELSNANAPSDDIQALISIKANLRDPLGALTDWDLSTPSAPCDWRGVGCYGHSVIELRLPNLHLGGSLSSAVSNLRMLRKLNLRSNYLNGTIPAALFRYCTLLQSIFLEDNLFIGRIPPEISNLTNLVVLNVAGNHLSGEVPRGLPWSLRFLDLSSNIFTGEITTNFSGRSQLQLINLSYNRISGDVPASLGKLENLRSLWLDYNCLVGTLPPALANCSALMHFSAEGNTIGGVVPAAIAALPKLQVISMSRNNLSGALPESLFCNASGHSPSIRIVRLGFNAFTEIGMPTSLMCSSVLQVLDLQENQISGGFPTFLTTVSTLRSIDLSGNLFSGSIPSEIGNLQLLEELKLANNSFIGSVPAEIANCRILSVLNLDGNIFSGAFPASVNELINLVVLSLARNNFSGSIPSCFRNLNMLEILNLRSNALTGTLPDELTLLSNLSTLDLSGNNLSGAIPTSIGNLKNLTILNLSSNGFSGRIPESIGSLFRLTSLDLSKLYLSSQLPSNLVGLPNLQAIALQENMLSGVVPEGLSSLLGMRYLNLSHNSFSGHISPAFGFLKSLVVLSLSNNRLSGSVPPQLGNCSSLEVLDLSSNGLSDEIPMEFSHLTNLNVLDLGRNNLSGQIPKHLSNCSSLASLSLDSNHLTGEIPVDLSLIPSLIRFNVSNNSLEGKIPVGLGSKFDTQLSFQGNPGLCGKPLVRKCNANQNSNRVIMFVAVTATGILVMLSCCCLFVYSFSEWREKATKIPLGEKKPSIVRLSPKRTSGDERGGPKLVMFNNNISLTETLEATRHFNGENVLSRTPHGVIFKACYKDGTMLAIHRLPYQSGFDLNTFRREAESLSRLQHRNITVLRGCYAGPGDARLLVYDYMPNGNLATLLQEASHQDGHVLNWPMRHLIALSVARGLAFLHASSMIHGDVRPQNVLFDADFEARVSGFGLQKLSGNARAKASTSRSGYAAPEPTAAKESDVYSFGIVLLELLTGKRPAEDDEGIVKSVKRQLQRGRVSELLTEPGLLELDPESSEWEEFLLGIKVGLLCTVSDPVERPTMTDVVFMLEGCRLGPDIASVVNPMLVHSPA